MCCTTQTLFSSYFRSSGGIQYLSGGVASGFNHVERDVYEPALLHIKGKRNTRTKEVPVSVASLNEGDAFILDLGMKLFLVRWRRDLRPRLNAPLRLAVVAAFL